MSRRYHPCAQHAPCSPSHPCQNQNAYQFTAYIDAVEDEYLGDHDPEQWRPPSSGFHMNYYQEGNVPEDGGLGGGPIAGADIELDVDDPTPTETHFTIDDDAAILDAIETYLRVLVTP